MPPAADDVPSLMKDLVAWTNDSEAQGIPCPIRAGIAHYQFATIHPYYDGNGRTARLLATLILHLGGYDLKGLYSLEEYYARDLASYYKALTIGRSHNYYDGRATSDITSWVDYFCLGMADSFETVKKRARKRLTPAGDESAIFELWIRGSARHWNCSGRTTRSRAGMFKHCSRSLSGLPEIFCAIGQLADSSLSLIRQKRAGNTDLRIDSNDSFEWFGGPSPKPPARWR